MRVNHSPGVGIAAPNTRDGQLVQGRPHAISVEAFHWRRVAPELPGQYRRADQSGLTYLWLDDAPLLPPSSNWREAQMAAKRVTDLILASLALIGLSPLLLLLAVLIKIHSPGPVLFRQRRVGLHGRPFVIYKFRSMSADRCDASGISQAKSGDPRITPIGDFLRRTNLDELPQLVNVLIGDMSLVGPRPHVSGMLAGGMTYDELVPYYSARLAVKPGLTGWAQANGLRGVTDDPARAIARIDHDIAYIQNYSWLLDVRCIARTIRREYLAGSVE